MSLNQTTVRPIRPTAQNPLPCSPYGCCCHFSGSIRIASQRRSCAGVIRAHPCSMRALKASMEIGSHSTMSKQGLSGPPSEPDGSRAFAQKDVGSTFARDVLRAFIAQSTHVDVVQEMLPGTEQDRPDGEMQLVDQGGAKILPNDGYATTDANVAAARSSGRLLQGGVNALGDKAKLRTSRHPERRTRVMRQHEDGRVIRRLVAPPALPAVVRPRASDGAEHVAPKNPGTDSGKALLRNSIVDPHLSIVMAVHPPP